MRRQEQAPDAAVWRRMPPHVVANTPGKPAPCANFPDLTALFRKVRRAVTPVVLWRPAAKPAEMLSSAITEPGAKPGPAQEEMS